MYALSGAYHPAGFHRVSAKFVPGGGMETGRACVGLAAAGGVSRQVHGHQCTLLGQVGDTDDGAGRAVGTEFLGVSAVHFGKVAYVLQEDVDMHDIVQGGTHFGQHRAEIFDDLPGLSVRIGTRHLRGGWVHTGRSRNADEGAGLGQVAVGANGLKHSGGGQGFYGHGEMCNRGELIVPLGDGIRHHQRLPTRPNCHRTAIASGPAPVEYTFPVEVNTPVPAFILNTEMFELFALTT